MSTLWKKLWCIMLSLALLLSLLLMSAGATETSAEQTDVLAWVGTPNLGVCETEFQQTLTENTEGTQAVIVCEDVTLRDEFVKHYQMSDGSYTATVYNEPVHQLVDGTWVEVDNTLTLSTSAKGVAKYQTVNGLSDVSFAQNFGDELVTMEQDEYSITWGVAATIDRMETEAVAFAQLTENLREPVAAEILPIDLSAVVAEEQKVFATKATSTIQYADALANGVNLEYTVLPSRIKESIILNDPQNISAYTVTVNTSNLLARLLANREVEFYTEDGENVFTMWAPYMYDSASELSEDIAVELTELGNGQYAITLTPDASWLNSSDRVYPVVIDPDVSASRVKTNIIDNTIMEGQGNQNRNLDRLYIGRKSGARVRAFLKYDVMPTIPSNATITAATQTLYITSGTDTGSTAGAYIVTGGDWASDTITWDNRPTAATTIQASISHNNFSYYRFSCLSAVQKWYTGSTTGKNANYGITVRYTDETINDYNAFYSADCSTESNRPLLEITYIVNSGGTGGGNSFDSAVALELGYTKSLNTVSAGELRYFKFTPNETASYIFQSSNSSGQPKVWLFDSNRVPMGTGSAGAGANLRYSHLLTAGRTYYIAAGHVEPEKGAYCLTVLRKATEANVENGFYYIQNRGTTLYLDIHGPGEQKYVHQWTMHTDEQEKWLIQLQSDGYWTIRSQYGDHLYIGVNDSSTGINNVQLFSSIFDQTRWNLFVAYDGTFIFEPKTALGKVMYAPNSYAGTEMMLADMGDGGSLARWVPAEYTYQDIRTFSAFDVGDSEENEVSIIDDWMTRFGYKNIGTYNNADEMIQAETIKTVGRYSDVVYINGHGLRFANMQIQYGPKIDVDGDGTEDPDSNVISYLCADDSVNTGNNIPKVGIGADWLPGSTTKTESYWNLKTKWGILAQCAQLDYSTNAPDAKQHWYNTYYSAQVWARTMLGDGERIHGYVGYYNRSPGGTTHTDRLNEFFTLCYYDEKPIIVAWYQAHTRLQGSSNWAAIYHTVNEEDTFQSMSNCTASGSPYTISYIARSGSEPSLPLRITENVSALSECSSQEMALCPMFVGGSSQDPILATNSVPSLDKISTRLQESLQGEDDGVLQIEENGSIIYQTQNHNWGKENAKYELSNEEAVDIAEQYLDSLGLTPEGEYRTTVSRIQRCELNIDGEEIPDMETVEYTISFYRTYNGIDLISDQEDGIVVGFNNTGLTELRYLWREIDLVANRNCLTNNIIPIDQALKTYQAELDNGTQILATSDKFADNSTYTSTAYLQMGNEVRPVYVFASDAGYTNCVFVDMYTGEVVTMS